MKNNKLKLVLVLLAFAFLFALSGCKKSYELSFETDGGNVIESVSLSKENEYELPTPTKEGYEFDGWYTTSDFSGEKVTTVTLTDNLTVYAKWTELYKVTLDLNGGTCDKTYVYGKAGETILGLLNGITPTKTGLTFGAWYINGTELSATTKLTSKGATVVAKYKAEYVINVYKQNITLDGYDLTEVKDSAYVDKKVSGSQVIEGFTEVSKDETIDEITISEDKTNNVMNVYYDRDQYTVTFRSNYPTDEKEDETFTYNAVYGEEFLLPAIPFSVDGYYLLGWSTSKDGEVIYNAHFLDNLAVNEDEVEVEDVNVSVDRDTSLYAIWCQGYSDMFGGADYLFKAEDDKVYLCRGGIYFVGEYYEDDNSFIFYNEHENIEGKLFDDNTFAFYNVDRDEYSSILYVVGTGVDENVKVLFDPYNGLTYTEKVNGVTKESNGTYTIDENGYYIATFTDGDLAGKTLTMVFGSVTLDDATTNAFQIRDEEEYGLGKLVRFAIYNNNLTYYTSAYDITLTGFGILSYNTGSSYTSYYYTYDKDTKLLTLASSSGSTVATAKVMTVNGVNGYMLYTASLDVTYTNENGDTLALNGMGSVDYTTNGTVISGYYSISSSVFGGYILTFTSNGETYKFYLETKTTTDTSIDLETATDEEKAAATVTEYVFKELNDGYAEYYYKDTEGTYYAPLIVLDETAEGKASVYAYNSSKTYELVLVGDYAYDEDGKVYVFNTTNVYETSDTVFTNPFDISTIKSFKFTLDTTSTSYAIHYYSEVTIGEETTKYGQTFTSSDGSKLVVIAGIASLSKDGYVLTGELTLESEETGLYTITVSSSSTIYVMIDTENNTFVVLDTAPFSAYVVQEDGSYSKYIFIEFDGLGGATYHYMTTETVEGVETEVQKEIVGTTVKTEDTTKLGGIIYQFTSEEKSFKYIVYSSSSAYYVFPNYENYGGQYTSAYDGILVLDGFGYGATYTDSEGNEITGVYSVVSENVIRLNDGTQYRYFDLEGKTFTARGLEYGTYLLMNNQGMPGLYLAFDGYGKVEVFKYVLNDSDEYEKEVVDECGGYSIFDDYVVLHYKDGANQTTISGYFGTYTYSSTTYNVFRVDHTEVSETYVNEKDWTVLILDGIGNAELHDKDGNIVNGTYKIITDTLIYYVNEDETDACIYTYNTEKGTIVENRFTARGYYTEDLKSLLFSQYGFAIFNNETRYYYTLEGNDVIIYHQDAESSNANEYGFVREVFGEFTSVKEYNGLTYYENDGYAITFNRKEETKDYYPVTVATDTLKPLEELVFAPTGSDTFTVTGSVKVNGNNYTCYVTRELVDGNYVMYVTVGSYRFDIDAKYTGKDADGNSSSTYEVLSMSYINKYYPYTYLYYYYILYSYFGSSYASSYQNSIGYVSFRTDYDQTGAAIESYCVVEFADGSGIVDLNGEVLTQPKGEITVLDSTNNVYKTTLVSTDGYTYTFYIYFRYMSTFSMYAFTVYAITRTETVKDNNYTVNVERIIYSENYSSGAFFALSLADGETELKYSQAYVQDDVWNYIVRDTDEETGVTTTTYYKLALTTKASETIEGETDTTSTTVEPYEKVTVTKVSATTKYSEDKKSFFDLVDGKVTFVSIDGTNSVVSESTYDEATNTYSITLSSGTKYTISFDELGNAVFTAVVETEE